MNVLVIDDDKMIRVALENKLKDFTNVITASSAFEAIEIVQNQKIDLIISDIEMPEINGLDFLSFIKTFDYHNIPVIIISSYTQDNLILKSHSLGAVSFVSKPIDFNVLISEVQKYSSFA